ncbi:dihydrofolate reductase family protein [Deinococcus sp.]|uniref:dihydrofolate reductase family protein n=1 Tax=Deinococcus sp. TaxID=47478 RepID=UPI003B5A3666
MRRLIVSELLTLDGVMEDSTPWHRDYRSPESGQFKSGELFGSDTLLLGRVTYGGFADYWPTVTDTGAFGERMNSLPKYVVSGTLKEAHWNNSHIIRENIAGEVARLKTQEGQDILVYGSGELSRFLLAQGLVDQLNLLIYPVVLGQGKRLFGEGAGPNLTLTDSRTFSSGVVLLQYHPAR